jgi:diguanylate cyclase (GGDEF)-like protein
MNNDEGVLRFDETELRGFSRSVGELEWLLLVLVLLYYVAPGSFIEDPWKVMLGMGAFAFFVLGFRYLNFYRRDARWKIALETWVMIAFITWTLIQTGRTESPLLNLYILVLITAGLTLGKVMTLLELALITSCYFWMGHELYNHAIFTAAQFSKLMAKFTPFLLVAYLTTMLSADLHYAKRMFQRLSQTDDLTGTYNRRAMMALVQDELEKAARYSRPFSVLMIDTDNLKQVNDRYGHDVGDRLVRAVAAALKGQVRASDRVARVGGDEFFVLMPETGREKALEAANRICAAISGAAVIHGGDHITTTVSVGLASYPEDGTTAEELRERADFAMYRSKEHGRNRVTTYPEAAKADETART